MRVLLFLFVALLVNLPYSYERWSDHRISSEGVQVEATVLSERELGGRYLVEYQLPEDVDPRRTHYSAAVDLQTYDNAKATDRIAVVAVPGEPDQNRPLGLVASSLFKVIAIVANSVLVVMAIVWWVRRRR